MSRQAGGRRKIASGTVEARQRYQRTERSCTREQGPMSLARDRPATGARGQTRLLTVYWHTAKVRAHNRRDAFRALHRDDETYRFAWFSRFHWMSARTSKPVPSCGRMSKIGIPFERDTNMFVLVSSPATYERPHSQAAGLRCVTYCTYCTHELCIIHGPSPPLFRNI